MNWFFVMLDWLNALLNTPLLSGQAGIAAVTGGRTLVFLACLMCSVGVILQVRRASPRLSALARGEQPVPIPADQLLRLIMVFFGLIMLFALIFGVQASSTYYAVQAKTIGHRDVVVSLTVATLVFHVLLIGLAVAVARLAVVIADVVTGETRKQKDLLHQRARPLESRL